MEIVEVAEEVGEEVAALQGEIELLTFPEWFDRTLDLFVMILRFIMATPFLRFFAVFGVFWVSVMLCLRLLRTGRTLARQ